MPHKLFIGSIPGDTDAADLLSLFRKHANVIKVTLAFEKKKKTALCKGYGFALCHSEADLQTLLSLKGRLFYRDRQISLREFQVGSQLRDNRLAFNMRRIFVGNVPDGTTVKDLESLFSSFGDIANIYFVKGDESDDARFGYVVYQEIEAANRALASKDKFYIRRQLLRVEEFGGKRAFALKQISSTPKCQLLANKTARVDDEQQTGLSKHEERSPSSEVDLAVNTRTGIDGAINLTDAKVCQSVLHRQERECLKSHLINGAKQNKYFPRAASSYCGRQDLYNKLAPSTPAKQATSSIQLANRPQRIIDVCVVDSTASVSTGGDHLRRIANKELTTEVAEMQNKSSCTVSEYKPHSLSTLYSHRELSMIEQNHRKPDNIRFNISFYLQGKKQTPFSAISPANSNPQLHSLTTTFFSTFTTSK